MYTFFVIESNTANESNFLRFIKKLVAKRIISRDSIREQVILKGNPEIGTIDFIRQHHDQDGIWGDRAKTTEFYQAQIFSELTRKKYKVVFSENPDIVNSEYLKYAQERIREVFETGTVSAPFDARQLVRFLEFGADLVYATLNPEVKLLPTQNLKILDAAMKFKSPTGSRDSIWMMEVRERVAAKIVRGYLDSHPGERVALVFGADHNFGFDFKRDLPLEGVFFKQFGERRDDDVPSLNEISFPMAEDLSILATYHKKVFSRLFIKEIILAQFGLAHLKLERERRNRRMFKRRLATQYSTNKLITDSEK